MLDTGELLLERLQIRQMKHHKESLTFGSGVHAARGATPVNRGEPSSWDTLQVDSLQPETWKEGQSSWKGVRMVACSVRTNIGAHRLAAAALAEPGAPWWQPKQTRSVYGRKAYALAEPVAVDKREMASMLVDILS